MSASSHHNLRLPYSAQGERSGNCGPCSLKMLADYYGIKNNKGQKHSVPSLNRICRVSRQWGTEVSDLNRTLRRLGLRRHKVNSFAQIRPHLEAKRPIITLFIDEEGGGHYAILKGIKRENGNTKYIFHDPYWGPNFERTKQEFKKQLKFFNNWLWAISP